nr:HLA class II histocompatibility antigen [Eptesicus fuscus gammaherpesvirus]
MKLAYVKADSAVLTCWVTGFYPSHVRVTWMKDKTEAALRPQERLQLLGDGNYQLRSELIVPEEHADKYTCRVSHISFPNAVEVRWKRGRDWNRIWTICGSIGLAVDVLAVLVFVLDARRQRLRDARARQQRQPIQLPPLPPRDEWRRGPGVV